MVSEQRSNDAVTARLKPLVNQVDDINSHEDNLNKHTLTSQSDD